MREEILQFLRQLETEVGVTILYACESGSRAWGFPSPDSDYDIRFIYRHPREWYLSVFERKDTINLPMHGLLDGSGWDIRKVLRLAARSNASPFEWLNSPIVYKEQAGFREELYSVILPCFDPKVMAHHYVGIATGTLLKEFQQSDVNIKKYFYALRPLLAARWVLEKKEPAPVVFQELLGLLSPGSGLVEAIHQLLAKKEQAKEGKRIAHIETIDTFLLAERERLYQAAQALPKARANTRAIGQFYRAMLGVES